MKAQEVRHASRNVSKTYQCEICGEAGFESKGEAVDHVINNH